MDLNQHGLTGSWYEPATSGQGLEVEVFPDQTGPGNGLVFVSWFTFDSVVGAAERQRWYTLSGTVVAGQPSAALTIYQNLGGNFNALPVTTAMPVGTATLSFDSCTSGRLAYSFSDGTGRTGTIPLTRLTQNVTCSTSGARPTNADFALSGNWYDPATSGQGLTVEVNPNSGALFAAWYTYAPSGASAGAAGQRWYTAATDRLCPRHPVDPGDDLRDHRRCVRRADDSCPDDRGRGQRDARLPELRVRHLQLPIHRREQQRLGRNHRLAACRRLVPNGCAM